jgi:3-keto-5-aminohexanoate cleavage enzyme
MEVSMTARVIAVAPNGGRRSKADHPSLPMTADEVARAAAECLEAGAAMIHLHVRRADGRHLLDADAYRSATAAIRRAVGDRLVVQITSEAIGLYGPQEQMAVVRDTKPEAASFGLRELVPDATHEQAFAAFLAELKREGVMPQIILYQPEDATALDDLQRRGLVPFDDVPVLYVLGRYAETQQSDPRDLLPFLDAARPQFRRWMLCAFGRQEIGCALTAALLGGDARVGFENNFHLPDGTLASDNAALVAHAAGVYAAMGLGLKDADAMRATWA